MNPFKRFWLWAFGPGDFGGALLFTVAFCAFCFFAPALIGYCIVQAIR